MGIQGWEHHESEWDDLTLAGILLPGTWTLDLAPECKIDVKKGSGRDGGRLTDKGYQLAELDCVGTLLSDDMAAWEAAVRRLTPNKPGGKRSNVSVRHPNASLMGVKFMKIRSVSGVTIDAKGMGTVKIRAIQWVAKPKEVKESAAAPPLSDAAARDLAYTGPSWLKPIGGFDRDVDAEIDALVAVSEKADPADPVYEYAFDEYGQMTRVGQ